MARDLSIEFHLGRGEEQVGGVSRSTSATPAEGSNPAEGGKLGNEKCETVSHADREENRVRVAGHGCNIARKCPKVVALHGLSVLYGLKLLGV